MARFWINLFTRRSWEEARARAFAVTGHRITSMQQAHAIEPGDYLLPYITGASVITAAQRVVRGPYTVDDTEEHRIWAGELYPVRFDVKLVSRVALADGVSLDALRERGAHWQWLFRRSLNEVPGEDGQWLLERLHEKPQLQASDPEPRGARGKISREIQPASGPTLDEASPSQVVAPSQELAVEPADTRRDTRHAEMQYRLAKLGQDMGLDVWIARNDRNAQWNGHRLGDLG